MAAESTALATAVAILIEGRIKMDRRVNQDINTQQLKPISQLRFDYDTTTTRLRQKIDMLIFLLASNRVEWKQARAIRRSRIVVVSQL